MLGPKLPSRSDRNARLVGCITFSSLICIPLAQTTFEFAPTGKLGGVETPVAADTQLSLRAWNDGKWQEEVDHRASDELGLRSWIIRLDNELRFSALESTKRPVVMGEGGSLFLENYFPGKSYLHPFQVQPLLTRLWNLKTLQQVMSEHGITLCLCISPNKAEVYQHLIPADQRRVREAIGSKWLLRDLVEKAVKVGGIQCIDLAAQFKTWQASAPLGAPPLFPPTGTHWSNYGAARATTYLLDELERMSGRDIVNLELAGTETSNRPVDGENDVGVMSNILAEERFISPSPQPVIRARHGDQGRPAKLLFVGTSFVWGLTRALTKVTATERLTVWYYFKSQIEFINGQRQPSKPLEGRAEDLPEMVRGFDFVIIEINESALTDLGQNFVKAALKGFGKEPAASVPAEILQAFQTAR